jgi:hypothetical protein
MATRPLVGQICTTANCDFEFVPASTGSKYRIEIVGIFSDISVVYSVIKGEFLIVNKWNWLGGGGASQVLVIDAPSVVIASQNPQDDVHQMRTTPSPGTGHPGRIKGKISNLSAFLRIKNECDPFNNSFCVHLIDPNNQKKLVLIFRGIDWIVYRQNFFSINGVVVVEGFKRIKLNNLSGDVTTYLSTENSRIVTYAHPLDTMGEKTESKILCRIIRINQDIGSIWVSVIRGGPIPTNTPAILDMSSWGSCDRRSLLLGAVLSVENFHLIESGQMFLIAMCPFASSLSVQELPPVGTVPAIRIYTLVASGDGRGKCLKHLGTIKDGKPSECGGDSNGKKFSLHSLCRCECCLDCEGDGRASDEMDSSSPAVQMEAGTDDIRSLFGICLRQAEVCLDLIKLGVVFHLKSPPFFNISIERVGIEMVGATTSDVAMQFNELPPSLRSSLFPPTKPLNSYCLCKVVQAKDCLNVLVPRDVSVSAANWYALRQLLIVNTNNSACVHGIVLKKETIVSIGQRSTARTKPPSPSKKSTDRRFELRERLRLLAM